MSTQKVNLWKIEGSYDDTRLARWYSRLPPSRNPTEAKGDFLWIPISLIEHTSHNVGGHHVVELPDWFVEKEKL